MKYSLTHRYSFVFLFIVFVNAFMDLGHKILLQDTLLQTSNSHEYMIYASILNAFILLPYIILFTPSGFISDKFSKPKVMFWTAAAAIPITLFITLCYYKGWFWGAFYATLLLGFQAAVNSPAKYGHVKEIFSQANIAQGNAYAQTMSILGILLGTAVYTILFFYFKHAAHITDAVHAKSMVLKAFAPLGFSLVALSCAETISTLFLAKKPAADPSSTYSIKNYITLRNLRGYWKHIADNKIILFCIICLSIFWGVNQVIIVAYGAYIKTHMLGGGTGFAQYALAIAGFGVLFGALYAGKISKGFIETGGIPTGALGMTVTLLFLLLVTQSKILISCLLLIYGFFGGLFIVPLNALVQYHAKNKDLGKVLAGNNFTNNIFMFTFLVGTTLASIFEINSTHILIGVLVLLACVTIFATKALPQSLIRFLLGGLIRRFYRVDVHGLDNIPDQGGVLLIGNHTSYLDWAMLQIACPRPIRFVLMRQVYQFKPLKWLFKSLKHIPISAGTTRKAFELIREGLEQGDVVCIFPEGRLSRNGQLAKFHGGFARAIEGLTVDVVPFYLRGLWGSRASHASSFYKKASKYRMRSTSVTFGPAMQSPISVEQAKQAVTRTASQSWLEYAKTHDNIARAIFRRANHSPSKVALIDALIPKMTYNTFCASVMLLKKIWKQDFKGQNNIGIILPASTAGVLANVTVLAMGKTVVNINFTAGKDNVIYAADTADCQTIITSRRFVKKIANKNILLAEWLADKNIIYFEDCIKKIDKVKIVGYKIALRLLPGAIGKHWFAANTRPDQTAAIIFSSGSEGRPKGVELTHSNILSNIKQTATVCNLRDTDVMLGMLPLFHSFGLTMSTLMPLVSAAPMVSFADPTDAYTIGKMVARHRVTIMFGTSTLFNIYLRSKKCAPIMFESLRLIVAGAEKLSPQVLEGFKLKFHKTILEGYGTTELSPVSGTNLPNELDATDMHIQHAHEVGTVGLPLPGTVYKIVDPDTGEELPTGEEGMIMVSGPQVMKGYLHNPEKTAQVLSEQNGFRWYETGDKGRLDEEGFLTIVDRYSRFAKIGGEMVSLGALEQNIVKALDDAEAEVMAVAMPDDKKGEVVCLVHTLEQEPADFIALLKENGMDNIMIPSKYLKVEELPKLGTGKRDYTTAKKLAIEAYK